MHYATGEEAAGPDGRTPFRLRDALDELADAGVLPRERRSHAEYAVWSSVHGMVMLANQGPLRQVPPGNVARLIKLLLGFIIRGI